MFLLMLIKPMTKLSPLSPLPLADINLRRKYRAIDSVATGRIPSLFCGGSELQFCHVDKHNQRHLDL